MALIKQPEFLMSDSMQVLFAGVNAVLDAGMLKMGEEGVSHHSLSSGAPKIIITREISTNADSG